MFLRLFILAVIAATLVLSHNSCDNVVTFDPSSDGSVTTSSRTMPKSVPSKAIAKAVSKSSVAKGHLRSTREAEPAELLSRDERATVGKLCKYSLKYLWVFMLDGCKCYIWCPKCKPVKTAVCRQKCCIGKFPLKKCPCEPSHYKYFWRVLACYRPCCGWIFRYVKLRVPQKCSCVSCKSKKKSVTPK